MRLKLILLGLTCCIISSTGLAKAHGSHVLIKRVEVDGKTTADFRILIYTEGGLTLEPIVVDNKFIVPPELDNYEWIDMRVIVGKHDLFFRSIHTSKFKTDWIIGFDSEPFDKENLPPLEPNKKMIAVYYMEFIPKKGLETKVKVEVYQ